MRAADGKSMIDCVNCPLLGCPGLRDHTVEQLRRIREFKEGELSLDRGLQAFIQGAQSAHVYTVLSGVLIRYRLLDDGTRQIINFHFPGDLVGLQATLSEPMKHSVEALTDARMCVFPRDGFIDFIGSNPHLGYDVIWLAAKEESALEEHLVALGRRSARERIAYLAIFLLERGQGTCVAEGNRLRLSVTQTQIADMLGLSLVHTNRSLQALRRDGLIEWTLNEIYVPEIEAAKEFVSFDTALDQPRPFL